MFQKNQLMEVMFEDVTHEGLGVAKPNSFPVFVAGGLPGEVGQIKITKMLKTHGFGRLLKLEKSSVDRVQPVCSVYKQCGGCHLQHLSYQGQLEVKRKIVQNALLRIGKLEGVTVQPVIQMDDPWRYRNKVQVPVASVDGELVTGFYSNRSHDVVAMDQCMIQIEENDEAVQIVKQICQKYHVAAYDEATHQGVLRHIMVRYGAATKELMLVLVTRVKDFKHKEQVIREIVAALPQLKSFVQNINAKRTNVILGEQNEILWGSDTISDCIGDIQFKISPHSFYQVNPVQTEMMYQKVLEFAKLTGQEFVIDAYCGVGTISLFLARQARTVLGIEIVPQAIADARHNAQLNDIDNVAFVVGAAELVMGKMQETGERADVVVIDPPRKGCDKELLAAIVSMASDRVVYVSCNPATLARDLRILVDGGYSIEEVQPFDMFPMTGSIEVIVQLSRGN